MSKAILFSKRGCTPCLNVKKFLLSETDLEFIEYDAEKDADKVSEYSIMSTPTLIIGDKRVSGFNPPKIMQLIDEAKGNEQP